ncbi:MarR family winged helix-turn-helix transcriptional regulator [Sandaracinobacteroides sp. A072]|uniref:MarR family winged helix-turn-helix transcriptional regulator n=1 Tax=Sandaracinobacteroides sp. A072 TaxID=3461146 RepID=UPI0040424104
MLKLSQFLPYRLSLASNAVSERIAGVYRARFGLRIPEWRLLAVIAERKHATQAELAVATRMDKMTISRAAAALVDRGLVKRTRSDDRRTLDLSLSEEGALLYAEVAPLAIEMEAELFRVFTPEEKRLLGDLLERLDACARS